MHDIPENALDFFNRKNKIMKSIVISIRGKGVYFLQQICQQNVWKSRETTEEEKASLSPEKGPVSYDA